MANSAHAVVRIGGDTKRLDGALHTSRAKVKTWAQKVRMDLGSSMRGAFSGLGTIGGLGSVAGLAMLAKQVASFEARITRLGIAFRMPTNDARALGQEIRNTAAAMGVAPEELLSATEKLVDITGDLDLVKGSLSSINEVLATTGAEGADVASMIAALSGQFGTRGKELRDAINVILGQGKTGQVPLRGLAANLAEVGGEVRKFRGWQGIEGVSKTGALFQIVGGKFGGDADRTRTSINALASSIVRNAPKLEAVGIKVSTVKDGVRQFDDLFEIIDRIGKATGGDALQIQKLLAGNDEAAKALEPILAGGRKEMERYLAAGQQALTTDELRKDALDWQASTAGRMAMAQESINEKLAVMVEKHLPQMTAALEKAAGIVQWMVDHPIATLAGLLGAKVAAGTIGSILLGGGVRAAAGAAAGAGVGTAAGAAGIGATAATVGMGAAVALSAGAVYTLVDRVADVHGQYLDFEEGQKPEQQARKKQLELEIDRKQQMEREQSFNQALGLGTPTLPEAGGMVGVERSDSFLAGAARQLERAAQHLMQTQPAEIVVDGENSPRQRRGK
ncbi:MAG: hypothetical protein V2A73_14805 [Pseudomonadota bacterium]